MENSEDPDCFDSIIIGAGITGVNAAYRITQQFPSQRYTIIDRRNSIRGT